MRVPVVGKGRDRSGRLRAGLPAGHEGGEGIGWLSKLPESLPLPQADAPAFEAELTSINFSVGISRNENKACFGA